MAPNLRSLQAPSFSAYLHNRAAGQLIAKANTINLPTFLGYTFGVFSIRVEKTCVTPEDWPEDGQGAAQTLIRRYLSISLTRSGRYTRLILVRLSHNVAHLHAKHFDPNKMKLSSRS